STMADNKDNAATSQERAVGITTLVAPNVPGFRCTIKSRYTDFLVNEISPEGKVLHLTDLKPKRLEQDKGKKPDGNAAVRSNGVESAGDAKVADETSAGKRKDLVATADASKPVSRQEVIAAIADADKETIKDIFGEEKTNAILALYASVLQHPDRKPRDHPLVKSDVIPDKAKRTEAHVAVRRIFSSKLETATMPETPGVISIKAASTRGPSGARAPINVDGSGAFQKGKIGWNELGGEYLHFSLYKENKDTMEVLYHIASRLKVPVKNFQFAGTKDRRAVTVQRVAIFRVHAERIAEVNKTARGWRVGDFEYKKHGLELGELKGNEFLLTLRDCIFDGEEALAHEQRLDLARNVLEQATKTFAETGFLNYYGLQRFGSFVTGTHVTGQKILNGDLEGAINSILHVPEHLLEEQFTAEMDGKKIPQDDLDRAQAIKLWRDGKGKEAMQKIPKRFQGEASIIQYLSKKDKKNGKLMQENDWQGALTQIPRNLRLMYVHAYQSFIWNTAAGKRWELFGKKVVEGDLVIVGEKDDMADAAKDEVDEDGEPIFHPAEDDSAPSAEEKFTRARPLSKEEAESGKFDLFDVVLPLPGYDVMYPGNELGKFYEEFMASEAGGNINAHSMRRSWKDISMSGAYRKLMARPGKALSFEVKSYVENEEQMVETDLERIQKLEGGEGGSNGKAEPSSEGPAAGMKKIAVVLKLQLGSSQYATMALRELTKGYAGSFQPEFLSR
ncbi:pseudouridine synthase, partial [Neohortaea acidophila]